MNILYVCTIIDTAHAFLQPHIEMLVRKGFTVELAANCANSLFFNKLRTKYRIHDIPFPRDISMPQIIQSYKEIRRLIEAGEYDCVHVHTPIASFCTRIACRGLKTKVIYTAHGFHFYRGASFKNWLLYFPVEWYLSRYTDSLITINREDFQIARQVFKSAVVHYVSGVGVDTEGLFNVVADRVSKRNEIGVPADAFLVLSVGELNENKNHRVVLEALADLRDPEIHYVVCGRGILMEKLQNMVTECGLDGKVHFLGHRSDVVELMKAADVFVHPSFREGLPVAVMESMAVGLPVICSRSRGNIDLIEDKKGGYLIRPTDKNGLASAIAIMKANELIRKEMSKYNQVAIKKFDVKNVLLELEQVYQDLLAW